MKSRLMKKPSKIQQQAIDDEVKKQFARIVEHIAMTFDAEVLYVLADKYGWRKRRLRKFYEQFESALSELYDYYGKTPLVDGHLEADFCVCNELKKIGVDVELWRSQKSNWKPENDECWRNVK